MNICYLLESTELCGGVRVVLDHARAQRKRGHRVVVRALRGDHHWYPYPSEVEYVASLHEPLAQGNGEWIVVATFWTTVAPALALGSGSVYHLCQGYEGDMVEYAQTLGTIEAAYSLPVPKLVIGEWLTRRLQAAFGPDRFPVYTIGQIVDTDLFRPPAFFVRPFSGRGSGTRVLISGMFEAAVKGIGDALRAITLLRQKGVKICLTRVSALKIAPAESELAEIDEAYSAISPLAMKRLYHRSDLFIAPSLLGEGFGLPFAEALACGVPAVATRIPSHMSFDDRLDYACFVSPGAPDAIADGALRVISDRTLSRQLRDRGPAVVVKKFRGDLVAERLEMVFRERPAHGR